MVSFLLRLVTAMSMLCSFMPIQQVSAQYKNLSVGLGTQTRHTNKIQKDLNGDHNNFEFRPYLTLGAQYDLTENLGLFPEFGLIFPHTSGDDNITVYEYFFLGTLGYKWDSALFKAGLGLAMTTITASGGTKSLRNGPSGSTDFPVPNGTSTVRNLVIDLGIEYFFIDNFSARGETLIFNPETSINRSLSYMISFYFHFDPFST